VAILRYRIWNIDPLIDRTLVYVPLTAIRAGLFTARPGPTQRRFTLPNGDPSDAAAVLTTPIVAAVFEPIRTDLKATVDHGFRDPPDREE